jgi:hypothetical protein
MFETIMDKDNVVTKGRDRASHPFVLALNNTLENATEHLDFTITLVGKSVEYAPYIYAAFIRAGGWGVLRDRVPFQIESVKSQGKNLLDGQANFNFTDSVRLWKPKFDMSQASTHGEVLVDLVTPLRFKTQGRYREDFDANEFMACLRRRTSTMCSLYGEGLHEEWNETGSQLQMEKRTLRWKDMKHYSARQHNSMVLGGVVGEFILSGQFSSTELAMLDFANLFHAGKNTSFGLGRVSVWERLS